MPQSSLVLKIIGGIITASGAIFCVYWYIFWQKNYHGDLLTNGPYSFVRHPFYSGFILLAIGLAMLITSTETIFLAIISIVVILYFIPQEETQLNEKFGKSYEKYIEEVPWRLIPGIY